VSVPKISRRWKAADRPAVFTPGNHFNRYDAAYWELVAINSKTATVRNRFIVGELGYRPDEVRVMDPAPWVITSGEDAGERLAEEPHALQASWEPRTLAQLRADGVRLGVDAFNPYDSGHRAEPKAWSHVSGGELAQLVGPSVDEAIDRFGRVDFEGDDGTSILTVWVERNDDGTHTLRGYSHGDPVAVEFDNEEAVPA
jgi:hypothetical protein